MNMNVSDFQTGMAAHLDPIEDSKFVDVLTCDQLGHMIGYCIGGSRMGPNAVLATPAGLIEPLFERFMALPTLPWMWGRLYLINVDTALSGHTRSVAQALASVQLDEVVLLPYVGHGRNHKQSLEDAYWTGLRLCRGLGMIEGRGVAADPQRAS